MIWGAVGKTGDGPVPESQINEKEKQNKTMSIKYPTKQKIL